MASIEFYSDIRFLEALKTLQICLQAEQRVIVAESKQYCDKGGKCQALILG